MKNYYISDLHLGHTNCIKFDERPFADIDEMASEIIRRWNSKVRDEGRTVCLCHLPIICWDKKHRDSYHVYGHVHSKVDEDTIYMMKQEKAFNCGCMLNDYYPCTLEELAENKKERNKKLGIF